MSFRPSPNHATTVLAVGGFSDVGEQLMWSPLLPDPDQYHGEWELMQTTVVQRKDDRGLFLFVWTWKRKQ
mgnify:CR=1 FL=1